MTEDREVERLRSAALLNAQQILQARLRADEVLRKQSEWMRITLDSICDAVISADLDGRVTMMNRVAEFLTGWSSTEAMGRLLPEVFHVVNEATREPESDPVLRALREGRTVGLENHTILIARDGSERFIDDTAAPITDDSADMVGAVLVFRDVTHRRGADLAQARLAAIVDSSEDAILSKTLDGVILTWNAGAERLFGYSSEEAVGKSILMLIPPDRLDEEREILARVARGDPVDHFETVRVRKDGRLVDISLTVSPLRAPSGEIVGASKVARDITDRRLAEEAFREADRRKDRFIALLAHELRNPLAPLQNGLNLIGLAGNDEGVVVNAHAMMERQLGHLVRMIDDLLDISRVNQGKMDLRKTQVLLSEVIGNAIETARPTIDARGHALEVSIPPEAHLIEGDLTRLAQVFGNLLLNAAKYTPPGGQITLRAERRGNQISVEIQDNGIGMSPEDLPTIFEIFSQVDRSYLQGAGGLGIGLALVKGLVEMHGGTVFASSPGVGLGSRFIVVLPALQLPPGVGSLPAPRGAHLDSAPSHRVLVVDDNRDAAASMATMLELLGQVVETAHDGIDAVTAARDFHPDAIFMDVGLPKLSGYEAVECIREEPWGREIAIFALTGWGQDSDRERSREAGCDGHLVKPLALHDLQTLLADLKNRT